MFKERINQLFMSREQTIYLLFLFIDCVVYGSFAATFTYYQIGLGTRFYSLIVSTGCIVGVVHAFVSADVRKKRWVFKHYRAIDLCESVFYTFTEAGFLAYYLMNGLNPLTDEKPVLKLIFFWSIFYRVVNSVVSVLQNLFNRLAALGRLGRGFGRGRVLFGGRFLQGQALLHIPFGRVRLGRNVEQMAVLLQAQQLCDNQAQFRQGLRREAAGNDEKENRGAVLKSLGFFTKT